MNNKPIQQFKDGAVNIKLWEQSNKDGNRYVNASVGKLYKDQQTGQWQESKSFSQSDILKLQTMLPQVHQEMQKWQEYYREAAKQQHQHEQPEPQPTPEQAERDSALAQAAPDQGGTPTNAPNHQPSR